PAARATPSARRTARSRPTGRPTSTGWRTSTTRRARSCRGRWSSYVPGDEVVARELAEVHELGSPLTEIPPRLTARLASRARRARSRSGLGHQLLLGRKPIVDCSLAKLWIEHQ